jgi:hypothetical protein
LLTGPKAAHEGQTEDGKEGSEDATEVEGLARAEARGPGAMTRPIAKVSPFIVAD